MTPTPNPRKKPASNHNRGLLIFFFFVLFLAAAVVLYPVYTRSCKLRAEEARLQAHLDQLKNERSKLIRNVEALKHSPAAIEKVARERLRFCRDGETIMLYEVDPQ